MPRGNPGGYNRYGDPRSGVKPQAKRRTATKPAARPNDTPTSLPPPFKNKSREQIQKMVSPRPGQRVGRNPTPATPRKVGSAKKNLYRRPRAV
jgi:hypothetical protein